MFMSASDVIYIPDRTKDLASRDKETVLALVSLENSYITNVQYVNYVEGLLVYHQRSVRQLRRRPAQKSTN